METKEEKAKTFGGDRRSFLRNAGVGAVAAALIMSCKKKKEDEPTPAVVLPPAPDNSGVNLGSGNTGILNYAYALEQLEAAFYTRVVTGSVSGTTPSAEFSAAFSDANERILIRDIMAHEIAHREFFKTALGSGAIQGLTPKFDGIDFTSRTKILEVARTFEDLGVGAYNGAGQLIKVDDPADVKKTGLTYLGLAGKIVSVEARHAAAIRDMLMSASFASNTNNDGLDVAYTPAFVLSQAQAFIVEKINGSNLPTA